MKRYYAFVIVMLAAALFDSYEGAPETRALAGPFFAVLVAGTIGFMLRDAEEARANRGKALLWYGALALGLLHLVKTLLVPILVRSTMDGIVGGR